MSDRINKGLGWKPERPDHRDARYQLAKPTRLALAHMPRVVDLREGPVAMPPIVDQGTTSSCVGNAIAGLLDFLHPDIAYESGVFMPSSRRFIYWMANVLEGTQGQDAGVFIRDGMKAAASGVPHEVACSFSAAKITKPPAKVAFTQAGRRRKIATYNPLTSLDEAQQCLAQGVPFVTGITVFSSFMGSQLARTGQLQMPGAQERDEGGHAVCVVGYNDDTRRFLVRNSWGTDWGMAGYFTMPYDYFEQLASDTWTARL